MADQDNDEATLSFTIAVEADMAPEFGDAAIADQSYAQSSAIDALQLPRATGGNGALTYTLTPDLPAGLSFDASTRQITGAPTTLQPAASYTYRVADQDNDEATLTFTIAVVADTAPSFGNAAVADQSYAQDRMIDMLQLPAASGGNGALTYTLTPELPAGLSLDISTRQISGAPTALQPALAYTWQAMDADSNRSEADTATLTFTIEVTTAEAERRALTHMLAATAQATLAGAVDVIGQRFDAAPGGSELSLAGHRVGGAALAADDERWNRPDDWSDRRALVEHSVDGLSLLRDSAFALPLAASGGESGGPGLDDVGPGRLAGVRGPQGRRQLGRRAMVGLAGHGCAPGPAVDGWSGALAGGERSGLPAGPVRGESGDLADDGVALCAGGDRQWRRRARGSGPGFGRGGASDDQRHRGEGGPLPGGGFVQRANTGGAAGWPLLVGGRRVEPFGDRDGGPIIDIDRRFDGHELASARRRGSRA